MFVPLPIRRVILVLALLLFGGIQLRFAWSTIVDVTWPESLPKLPLALHGDSLKVSYVTEEGKRAGVEQDDTLVSVNGRRVQSYLDAMHSLYANSPGTPVELRLTRADKPVTIRYTVAGRSDSDFPTKAIPVILNIITPLFCIALGFLVAFRRVHEPAAYAFLVLLLTISQLLKANSDIRLAWPMWLTWPQAFLDSFADRLLLPSWLWFALEFPDPKSKRKLVPWALPLLGIPFLLQSLAQSLVITVGLHYPPVLAWTHYVALPEPVVVTLAIIMGALGAANLVYKLRHEADPGQRRRLRWVLFGLTAGLVPIVTLLIAAGISHKALDDFPWIILGPAVLSPFFVPLTLAYAVLVDRVYDVGVFVRQGLLAAGTVSVVKVSLMAGLMWLAFQTHTMHHWTDLQRWSGIAVCFIGIAAVTRAAEWVRGWVDQQFFQEQIDTERVLLELSKEVRQITDPQLLLRTVTERIARAFHVPRAAALLVDGGRFVPAYSFGSGFDPAQLPQRSEWRGPLVLSAREARTADRPELLLPLSASDRVQGVLTLGAKRSEEPYSQADIRLLESVAHQTALALENSRLAATVAAEVAQRERVQSELEIAQQVQQRLFPKAAPQVAGLQLAGVCRPAQEIGGDYYDFVSAPSGEVGLAIGDVAGKGISAALLMAGLQASLRGLTLAGISDLSDLMAKLNRLVYDASPANRFATFFYALYDPASRRLRYSSAGHNPALLMRASGEAVWLKTRGVALGLTRVASYGQGELTLEPGDCLVLYTDGVTEARNENGDEYNEERLKTLIAASAGNSAPQVLLSLLDDTASFVGAAPQHDDLTVIVARAN